MKSKFLLLLTLFVAGSFLTMHAQGGFQQLPIEERVKNAMDKLAVFNLDAAKKVEVDSILTQSYRALDAKRMEIRNNSEGGDQREAMRTEMQKISDARDEKLKKVFSDEQYKKWKEEIEPELRPRRPGGGRNN